MHRTQASPVRPTGSATSRRLSLLNSRRSSRQSGRVGLVVALLLLGSVVFFAWRKSAGSGEEVRPRTTEELYREDNRLRPVLEECQFIGPFDADTTDVPAILASKLDAGAQREPQNRARTDLAAMGDSAEAALRRVFDNAMVDEWRTGVVKNVLAVCALSESDFGVEIAKDALRHVAPDVRSEAITVLQQHPKPEYYDIIKLSMPDFRMDTHLERMAEALCIVDPKRAALDMEEWFETAVVRNGFISSKLIDAILPLAARSSDPEVAKLFLRLETEVPGLMLRHRSYLLAPSAGLGDEASLQRLRDTLAVPETQGRYHALRALQGVGLVDEGFVIAETGVTGTERATALALLLDPENDEGRSPERIQDLLALTRRGLQDETREVQETALRGLLNRRDQEGSTHLLRLLQGTIDQRALATHAMREALGDNPELADQARASLIAQWDREVNGSQRPEELISILTTLGAVPGEATGQFIADTAEILGENSVQGTSGFHWAIGQVFNAGPAARGVLRQRIRTEKAPLRRLDLIQFLWQDFTDESAEILLGIVDDESKSGFERLYAADRLLRMGRPEEVVPVFKRVYRTTTDPILKPGLECLLWAWFGPAVG